MAFDPSQPYEVVDAGPPAFNPDLPFETVPQVSREDADQVYGELSGRLPPSGGPQLNPSISAKEDFTQRIQRGVLSTAGKIIQGAGRLADLRSQPEIDLARATGTDTRNPVSRAIGSAGRAMEQVANDPLNTYIDPARDKTLLAKTADIGAPLIPILATGVATGGTGAALSGGLLMGEEGAREAQARGDNETASLLLNTAGGFAMNSIPGVASGITGRAVRQLVPEAGPLITRGYQGIASALEGAGVNAGGDALLQLADTGTVDSDRVRSNVLMGGGIGGLVGLSHGPAPRIELDRTPGRAPATPAPDLGRILSLEDARREARGEAPAPAAQPVLDGPSVPAVADDLIVEPLGKRYLVLDGVGEPVEQFRVRRRGDPRGVTLDRATLEAQGISVMDRAPEIDTPSTPPVEIADAPEARIFQQDNLGQRPGVNEVGLPSEAGGGNRPGQGGQVAQEAQALTGGGGPPDTTNSLSASGGGGVPPGTPGGPPAVINAGGPPAIPPSGIVPVPPGPPPSNNPIPRSIYNGPVEAVWGELKRKLVDFAAPIEDTLRKFEKEYGFTTDPNSRISNFIDRAIRAPKMAGQFVKDSGLQDVIRSVDDLDDFGNYLTDLHSLDVAANGIQTGRNIQAAAQNVRAKAPLYAKAQQQVKSASDALLGLSVNYGLISPELATHLNDLYPNYVPFERVFDALEKEDMAGGGGSRGVASLSKQDAFKRFEGSTRPIENPLGSILKKVEDVFVQGERNLAGQVLAEYRNLPGFNQIIREVPKGHTARNTFSFLDEGTKRTFEVPKEIADAAKNLNSQQLGTVMSALSLPMRIFKLGTTGINPVFAAKNVIRDLQSAIVQSPNTYAAMTAMPRALFEAVGHGELYDQVNRAGGMQTSYDLLRNEPMQTVQRIRSGRSIPSKILYTATHPGEILRAIEDTVGRTEEFGRIQNFVAGFEDATKQGLPPEEAITQGARYARETTANFARKGEWGSVINALWPYFNANIQGVRGTVRALRRDPLGTALKWGVTIATPVTAAVLWNLSDEKRKEAWGDIAEYEKENNIIILPPNPQKDDKGRWNAIRIPLQPGIGKATSLIRRPLEALNGQDPVAFAEMARALIAPVTPIDPEGGTLASNASPIIARPLLEARLNKNFYTDQPIVPERLMGLVPELQYTKNTSRAAIQIGETLGVSPMKVDHVLRGYGGEVASNVTNGYDRSPLATLGDSLTGTSTEGRVGGRSIPEGFERAFTSAAGGNTSRKFYEALTAAEQARESYRQLLISGQNERAATFFKENSALINAAPALGALRRAISNVTRVERTDGVDAQYQKTLREQREAIVRQGVETLRDLQATEGKK